MQPSDDRISARGADPRTLTVTEMDRYSGHTDMVRVKVDGPEGTTWIEFQEGTSPHTVRALHALADAIRADNLGEPDLARLSTSR